MRKPHVIDDDKSVERFNILRATEEKRLDFAVNCAFDTHTHTHNCVYEITADAAVNGAEIGDNKNETRKSSAHTL